MNLMRGNKRRRRLYQLQRKRLELFHTHVIKQSTILPYVVVLTGAGISAESGLRTFRASDGLWEEHRIEDVATPEGYQRNPQLVHTFYNERRRQLFQPEIGPNQAHLALARLEHYLPEHVLIITQNVDNLHERAYSNHIIHMHGQLLKARCPISETIYDWQNDLPVNQPCMCCTPTHFLRPHIVWFNEMPLELPRIYHALKQADYFISIGTSGNVYPAADFVFYAKQHGAYTIELNLESTNNASLFDEHHYGKASEIVPEYIDDLLLQISHKSF